MSTSRSLTISKSEVPLYAIILLAAIFAFGLFVVGYDQGHIFSIVLGQDAYSEKFMHELFHDMRHAAGFPCH